MAKGRKTGGRQKGTPNAITREVREVFKALIDKKATELEAMIDETRFGIEIEKQTEQGTVVGRLNADPGKAAELTLKLAEFAIPKLARVEKTIADATDDELLAEVRRRAAKASETPA